MYKDTNGTIYNEESGEWQTDENGQRFRKIGNIIEHEMTINGIAQSQFFEMNRKKKEMEEKNRLEAMRKAQEEALKRRHCPFNDSMNTDCKREKCALFGTACAFKIDKPALTDTKDRLCPFGVSTHKCRTDCALYNRGCTLTNFNRKEE